jgi:hypothetical protein
MASDSNGGTRNRDKAEITFKSTQGKRQALEDYLLALSPSVTIKVQY